MNLSDPEFETVESLVEYLLDEERASFTWEELGALCFNLRKSHHAVRLELEGWGLCLEQRAHEKKFRGVSSSDSDRYWGPGSSPSCGGSGWEQISGFAGRNG